MANVTDSSSLLVVPSGWSDGVLGSLKPDDGSGDFTFSRGSDLSATRVNEDGYIEKGYENLLLQSNSFDLSPWTWNSGSATGGQTDRDGGSDAYLVTRSSGGSVLGRTSVSLNGVYTFSIYVKINASNGIGLAFDSPAQVARFNISDENQTTAVNVTGLIDSTQEYVGNNFYRLTISGNTTATNVYLYMLDAIGENNISSGGSHIIQDAMLNQGLVAYPYIETTTTTAKAATISEDQPRIDYTSGNGAVLIEPSRTNLVNSSEFLQSINEGVVRHNEIISPEGTLAGTTVIFGASTNDGARISSNSVCLPNTQYTFSFYVKSLVGTGDFNLRVATNTSSILTSQNFVATSEWTRIKYTFTTDALASSFTSNNRFRSVVENNEIAFYGVQLEQGTQASSYIPTYGTASTCVKDTATLTKNVAATGTIFININAGSTKTLTFLGGNVSVTQGVNKIALAYSPTALKISHNGSIVQNIARSLDTSSLTEIQLGHRNNFEQTTDSINQFLTLDSFLTDTELNELTA